MKKCELQDVPSFGEMWNTKKASEYCGYSEGHFKNMRSQGDGPLYYVRERGGKKEVRYAKKDCDKWLHANFYRVDPAA